MWIKIHVEVLAGGQNAVVVRKQYLTGEEARKLVQIQKISGPRGEFRIGGRRNELRKINHAPLLFRRRLCFQIVNRRVSRPLVAEMFEKIAGHGLEHWRCLGSASVR